MTDWFVRDESGSTTGPYRESHVKTGLETGAITDAMLVRQHGSDWFPAEVVRVLFARLESHGFFVRDRAGGVFGPFTKQRVLEMDQANQLPNQYWIRQGKQSEWTEIRTTLMTPPVTASPRKCATKLSQARLQVAKDSDESIRLEKPIIPAAPVMKLRGNSLLDRFASLTERVEDALFGGPLPNV